MSSSHPSDCPFCSLPEARVREHCALGLVIDDRFPVSPGHSLIVARRHVAGFFDLTPEEVAALMRLLDLARRRLEQAHRPDGFNIGINVGETAGQTVAHVHIHLIPRFRGDVPDPTGGVRNVVPGKGRYPAGD